MTTINITGSRVGVVNTGTVSGDIKVGGDDSQRRVIVVSDLHPDKSTAGFPRFDDVAKAGRAAAGYAHDNTADLMVFAGDLCEPDSRDYIRCCCLLMEIAELCGCAFLAIPGNHDVVEDGRGTTSLDPLQYLPDVTLSKYPEVLDVECGSDGRKRLTVATFPYVSQDSHYDPTETLLELVGKHGRDVDLVVSHLMLDGIGPGSEADMVRGRDVFLPVEEIQKQWPRAKIVQGHYHSRQVFNGVQVVGSLANFTRADALARPVFLDMRI